MKQIVKLKSIGGSKAIIIPAVWLKELDVKDDEVMMEKSGFSIIITPIRKTHPPYQPPSDAYLANMEEIEENLHSEDKDWVLEINEHPERLRIPVIPKPDDKLGTF